MYVNLLETRHENLADNPLQSAEVAQVKVVRGSDAYHEAMLKEPVSLWNTRSLLLMCCLLLGCFCQTMSKICSHPSDVSLLTEYRRLRWISLRWSHCQ
jgi:hypothetical protein